MRVIIKDNPQKCAEWAADYIVKKINEFSPTPEKPFVLGLPTGSTPLPTYKRLIDLYKQGKVSFANVVTFNMDEYIGLDENHPQSYHYFMRENFFKYIDIKPENINILNGMAADPVKEAEAMKPKSENTVKLICFWAGSALTGILPLMSPAILWFRGRESRL